MPSSNDKRAAAIYQSQHRPEGWESLQAELRRIPAMSDREIFWGHDPDTGTWWCTFSLNLQHPNVFDTIYALGHSLNRFNASGFNGAFYPTGPYYGVNPDVQEHLEWMIDSFGGAHDPAFVAEAIALDVFHLEELAEKADNQ